MDANNVRNWLTPLLPERPLTMDMVPVRKEIAPILSSSVPDIQPLNGLFDLYPRKGFFFHGPAGTGKHRSAILFAGSLKTKCGYDCYTVRNSALNRAKDEEVCLWASTVINMACQSPVFLLLENPSQSEKAREFLDVLMEEMQYSSPLMKLILVVSDTDISIYREEWQDLMMILPFALPDTNERKDYVESRILNGNNAGTGKRVTKIPIGDGIATVYIADMMDGFNYNQMKQVMDLLGNRLARRASEQYLQNGIFYEDQMKTDMVRRFFACSMEDINWAVANVRKGMKRLAALEEQRQPVYNQVYIPQSVNVEPSIANSTYTPSRDPEVVPGTYTDEELGIFGL